MSDILFIGLLVLCLLLLLATDGYVKSVSNYCKAVEEANKARQDLIDELLKSYHSSTEIYRLLYEQYENLYNYVIKEGSNNDST